jgi:hypothetical protein
VRGHAALCRASEDDTFDPPLRRPAPPYRRRPARTALRCLTLAAGWACERRLATGLVAKLGDPKATRSAQEVFTSSPKSQGGSEAAVADHGSFQTCTQTNSYHKSTTTSSQVPRLPILQTHCSAFVGRLQLAFSEQPSKSTKCHYRIGQKYALPDPLNIASAAVQLSFSAGCSLLAARVCRVHSLAACCCVAWLAGRILGRKERC